MADSKDVKTQDINTMSVDEINKNAKNLSKLAAAIDNGDDLGSVVIYEADGVNLSSKSGLSAEAAFRELKILQQNCIIDYKEWAKLDISYMEMNMDAAAARSKLKRANDSYATSMLMSCLSPLTQGITIKSICASWFTFKLSKMMNPNWDEDMSRLFSSYRTSIMEACDKQANVHPMLRPLYGFAANYVDSKFGYKSAELMGHSIAEHTANNSVDDLIMTPRQLAALKLNFMEQYYTDMRSISPSDSNYKKEMERFDQNYNNALAHIRNIAMNGGYDMSVVASEERYLVGLKAMENPSYLNLFDATENIYGAKPVIHGDASYWDGDFVTGDGHPFTVGSDSSNGAFTVRRPFDFQNVADTMERTAEQFAAMVSYVKSPAFSGTDDIREATIDRLNKYMSDYQERVLNSLADDGYGIEVEKKLFGNADHERNKFWDEHFASVYNAQIDRYSSSSDMDRFAGYTDSVFTLELNLIIEKQFAKKNLNASYVDDEDRRQAIVKYIKTKHPEYANVSDDECLNHARNMYTQSLSDKSLTDLLIHVGTNMAQGYNHGKYYRDHIAYEYPGVSVRPDEKPQSENKSSEVKVSGSESGSSSKSSSTGKKYSDAADTVFTVDTAESERESESDDDFGLI